MHIHALMLCRMFEPIPIEIGFLRILKVAMYHNYSACQLIMLMLFSSLSMLCGKPCYCNIHVHVHVPVLIL